MSESLEVGEAGVGARGIGEVTGGWGGGAGGGVVGFLHSAGLKEKNLRDFKEAPPR